MQIMTKINDFEKIFFKSSIIFHVFARNRGINFSFMIKLVPLFILLVYLMEQRWINVKTAHPIFSGVRHKVSPT